MFTEFGQLNESEVEAKSKEAEELVKVQNKKVPLVQMVGNGRFARFLSQEKK